jgi:hypothetical protein
MRPAASQQGGYMKKLDWIVEGLQAPLERGEILFGSQFPKDMFARVRHELTNLGQVAHEDIADALVLFLVKGVRVENPHQHGVTPLPKPPDLGLFDIEGRSQTPAGVNLSLVEEAFDAPAVAGADLDLMENKVAPLGIDIKLDP